MKHGLREWIRTKYGEGKPFKNPSQLSDATGLSRSIITTMERQDSANLKTLRQTVAALGMSMVDFVVEVGWASPDDLKGERLTPQEKWVLEAYRKTVREASPLRHKYEAVSETLLGPPEI